MGKGDKKSRRGKIIIGSFGVRRPRRKKKGIVEPPKPKEIKVKAKPVDEHVKPAAAEVAAEEKKAAKKAAVKKVEAKTKEAEAKPKVAKPKKKAEPKEAGAPEEPAAEAPKE